MKILIIVFVSIIFTGSAYPDIININLPKQMTLTETEVSQRSVKIKCTEMSCDACKRSITKSIDQLKGIKNLDINLETKIITVIYDDEKTDEQSILNAVIGAGYEAEITN